MSSCYALVGQWQLVKSLGLLVIPCGAESMDSCAVGVAVEVNFEPHGQLFRMKFKE